MKKNNNRSILIMLLLVMLAASFMFGCGDNNEAEKEQRAQKQEQLKERQKEAQKKAAEKKEQAKKKDAEKKATEKSGKKYGKSAGNKSTGKTADNDSSKGNDEGSSGSDAKDKKASSKKPAKTDNSSGSNSSSSSSSSSAKNTKKTCTIKITCSKLVGNKDLDDAQRARVPKNGVILEKTTVEISSGDSVYDILKKACKKKGIVLAAENTSLGIYVAGIDGFYEKDAGGESGWKYKVNGKYPNDSAGDVKVKNGDVIEWVYVLEA